MTPNTTRRIDHVIVLMLENRSFDHLFGFFAPAPGQTVENLRGAHPALSNLLDPSQPKSATNPDFPARTGAPFAVHDKEGPSHSFNAVCVQLCNDNSGPSATNPVRNNGFVRSYKDDLLRRTHRVDAGPIQEVMESFSPEDLPTINALARNFCLCDHWSCEVPGPTMPNRMFIHAATSEGYVHNAFKRVFTSKTIYDLVEEAGLTWATYFHDLNEVLQFQHLARTPDHFRRFEDRWATDIAQGKLPNYSFILPRFNNRPGSPANSQHAPEDVRFGEHLIADVYDALAAHPAVWNRSVLIVTYDEHGGFYDHVAPGAAPNPDGINSPNADDQANFRVPPFAFDRIGLRVPAIIASPWIQKGSVENRSLQHTSVIKTVREIFGLGGPLNHRDSSAASFADLFQQLAAPRPATDMPMTLPRPSLPNAVQSFAAGVPVNPEDEPLDSLTEEWLEGLIALTGGATTLNALGGPSPALPATQGEAADLIDNLLKTSFGI